MNLEAARREAHRRYDGDTIIDENTGEPTSFDDWGYAETERRGFIAGVEWVLELLAGEEAVERAAKRYWLESTRDAEGDLPDFDWEPDEREQFMWATHIVLAALGNGSET